MPAQEAGLRDALEAALRESAALADEPRRADRAGRPGQRACAGGPRGDLRRPAARSRGTAAAFCEQCGTPLGARAGRRRRRGAPSRSPCRAAPVCRACGGTIADDGYCEQCGEPAVNERDHWSELPSALVGGVCDRGRRHTRNEDAMALARRGHRRRCSSSATASRTVAGLRPREPRRRARRAGRAGHGAPPAARVGAWSALLVTAAARGRPAIADAIGDMAERAEPPSCTFVAAVVDGPTVVAGLARGLARVLGARRGRRAAGQRRRLRGERDDRARRPAGPGRGVARGARDHALARAPTPRPWCPAPATTRAQGPGWVLVCSDGLWNYCSEAADVADLLHRTVAHASGRRPTRSPASWSAGPTSRAGTTTSPRRWPASPHPSILSRPTRRCRPTGTARSLRSHSGRLPHRGVPERVPLRRCHGRARDRHGDELGRGHRGHQRRGRRGDRHHRHVRAR